MKKSNDIYEPMWIFPKYTVDDWKKIKFRIKSKLHSDALVKK